ncbi:MAG: hypothetical protein L2C94_006425, partial [Aigarchaeota archaeon]|nr:hypothetical protein [Candidatus Wolframiiraptor gerlachensis]
MDEEALSYLSSLAEDQEILLDDIEGTMAHVIMLCEQGIIPRDDAAKILSVLKELREKAIQGELRLEGDYEDVHEFVESKVIERLGIEIGGKHHTGRAWESTKGPLQKAEGRGPPPQAIGGGAQRGAG